ncbi:MAG: hypothetical protein LBC53_09690 [Spirochaetaceae bacterium]|nr:hypothetical protein [Spirochaetaceae bacterium]
MPSPRASGYGGYHAAYADDFDVFFSNPAVLSKIKKQIALADLTFSLLDFGMVGILLDYVTKKAPLNYMSFLEEGIENGLYLGGPLASGFIGDGWGVGFFNNTRLHIRWVKDEIWRARFSLSQDFFIMGGLGFQIFDLDGLSCDAGFTAKLFQRGSFLQSLYLQELKYVLENMRGDVYETQVGGGVDLGVQLSGEVFQAGLVLKDPFSPALVTGYRNYENYKIHQEMESVLITVTPRLAVGAVFYPPAPDFWSHIITNFLITADFKQLLFFLEENWRNPLLELSAGFEIELTNAFSFRIALNEMYPAAGLGFDAGFLRFDASIYLRELGQGVWETPRLAIDAGLVYRYPR